MKAIWIVYCVPVWGQQVGGHHALEFSYNYYIVQIRTKTFSVAAVMKLL